MTLRYLSLFWCCVLPGVRGHRSAHEPENLTNGRVRGRGRMFKQTFKGQQQNVISLLTLIRSSLPVFSPFQVPFLCTLMQPCCFSIDIYWSYSFLSWWVLTVSQFCSFRCWRSKSRAPWWVIHTLQVSTTSLKCTLWELRFVRQKTTHHLQEGPFRTIWGQLVWGRFISSPLV